MTLVGKKLSMRAKTDSPAYRRRLKPLRPLKQLRILHENPAKILRKPASKRMSWKSAD